MALWLAADRIDWIALHAHKAARVGLLAACLAGVAALYFAALLAVGVRPRDLKRRGQSAA